MRLGSRCVAIGRVRTVDPGAQRGLSRGLHPLVAVQDAPVGATRSWRWNPQGGMRIRVHEETPEIPGAPRVRGHSEQPTGHAPAPVAWGLLTGSCPRRSPSPAHSCRVTLGVCAAFCLVGTQFHQDQTLVSPGGRGHRPTADPAAPAGLWALTRVLKSHPEASHTDGRVTVYNSRTLALPPPPHGPS